MEDKEFNEKYEQLKKSKFLQQKILGWRPIPTISCITITYISLAIFFIIFGILILVFTSQLNEISIRYDNCQCQNPSCQKSIQIYEKMKKPVMIYYQIDGFSQNHKAYMNSKSDKQLKGEDISKEDLIKSGVCDNILYIKDIDSNAKNNLADDKIAIPCGKMPKSYLRDKFENWTINGAEINITKEDIIYKSDKQKYKYIESTQNGIWTNVTDENFINWMKPSPFSNPRKLWGIIKDQDLEKDCILSLEITNLKYCNNTKYIILATRNVFGGKSMFLGLFYIIFGILCLIASITFIIAFSSFHKKNKN